MHETASVCPQCGVAVQHVAGFPAAKLVGSEIFTAGLGFAVTRAPGASFVQMDARCIPYSAKSWAWSVC
jgi:hypothetical protein